MLFYPSSLSSAIPSEHQKFQLFVMFLGFFLVDLGSPAVVFLSLQPGEHTDRQTPAENTSCHCLNVRILTPQSQRRKQYPELSVTEIISFYLKTADFKFLSYLMQRARRGIDFPLLVLSFMKEEQR